MPVNYTDPSAKRETVKVHVKFIRPTLVAGNYCDVGAVASVPELDASRLIESGRAAKTDEDLTPTVAMKTAGKWGAA